MKEKMLPTNGLEIHYGLSFNMMEETIRNRKRVLNTAPFPFFRLYD